MANSSVVILLSSYNGQKFIRQQIESIIHQDFADWTLLIRDDKSVDDTVAIIQQYESEYNNIHLVQDRLGNIGPLGSFKQLLSYVDEYQIVMFCDQDDIWKANKVSMSVNRVRGLMSGKNSRVLVYSNYEIDNNDNRSLAYNHDMSSESIPSRILAQSWLMGCTMAMSTEMAIFARDIPASAENHDNWYAKVSSLVGVVGYIHTPTMIHRLHDSNVTSRENSSNTVVQIRSLLRYLKNKNAEYNNLVLTCEALMELCQNYFVSAETEAKFYEYTKLFSGNPVRRLIRVISGGFAAYSFNQNVKLRWVIMFGSRTV